MGDRVIAPYGAWASPIRIDDVVGDVIGLAEPWLDGAERTWLEARPAEAGRRVLVRSAADGTVADMTPPPLNVRTRVHEYGGGSYTVSGGTMVVSNFTTTGSIDWRRAMPPRSAITPEGPWRYADLAQSMGDGVKSLPSAKITPPAARHGGRGRSWRSRSTAPAPQRSCCAARTSWPRHVSRRTGAASPGSNGTTRTCPGMPPGLRTAAIAPDGTLGEPTLRRRRP